MGLFSGILGAIAPIAGSALGSAFGGPLGGQLGGAIGSAFGASSANSANRAAAQRQMDFQRDMRDTSYQAAVKDIQAAGLNPAMMYASGGSGAAVPSGAMSTSQNIFPPELVNSAMTAAQINQQNKAIEAQVRNTDADTINKLLEPDRIKADTDLKTGQHYAARTQGHINQQLEKQAVQMIKKIQADTHLSDASAEQVRSQNMAMKELSKLGEHGSTLAAILQLLMGRR